MKKNVNSGEEPVDSKPAVEYSSREVSPSALLVQQLLQAYHMFTLHHGPSLSELFVRLSRDKFCNTLDRYWSRFCKTWDVLLHGNPATEIFGGLKLASGGELGFGVGEEDWGSGEREVLEDLTQRTEGMIDCVVSRFGEPATAIASDYDALPEHEALPWMGSGNRPVASDGVVFGGVGAVSRPALRNISLWIQQIYTYGEYAYGVRDNPLRERRKRRRRNPPELAKEPSGEALTPTQSRKVDGDDLNVRAQQQEVASGNSDEPHVDTSFLPKDKRPQIHGRIASQDYAQKSAEHTPRLQPQDRPGIPPPIAAAAKQSLHQATKTVETQEPPRGTLEDQPSVGSTMGIPDGYMKYLTFGLSELGRGRAQPTRPSVQSKPSDSSSLTIKATHPKSESQAAPTSSTAEELPALVHRDPVPEGENLKVKIALQKRQENQGHFVIGLKGDLHASPLEETGEGEDEGSVTDGSFHASSEGSRIVLRTVQVEVKPPPPTEGETPDSDDPDAEPENIVLKRSKRVRVLIYVHRPFVYCFLFENRTTSLQYSAFYKDLHRNLLAIHKPLLGSTDVRKVAQRIEASHAEAEEQPAAEAASIRSAGTNRLPHKGGNGTAANDSKQLRPIFDLIYDPAQLTVHTSIPNIPEPGTSAAEGLAVGSGVREDVTPGWTRLDALNVHSVVLATLESVRMRGRGEWERTCKTGRGWWVVWMKVPSSPSSSERTDQNEADAEQASRTPVSGDDAAANQSPSSNDPVMSAGLLALPQPGEEDLSRIAFLIRKSSDALAPTKTSASTRVTSSLWQSLGLRSASSEAKTGGPSAGWGPGALAGGLGLDARRYVEGLMSLNR